MPRKHVPARRPFISVEESIYRGTQWVAFAPNDQPPWPHIRPDVSDFTYAVFREGASHGSKTDEACFVKSDRETTTQSDIDRGTVNIQVNFASSKPAEFVVIRIQQVAG